MDSSCSTTTAEASVEVSAKSKYTADCVEWNGLESNPLVAFGSYELVESDTRIGQVLIGRIDSNDAGDISLTFDETKEIPGVFDLKFSGDGVRLAAATADGNFYVRSTSWSQIDLQNENCFSLSLDWNNRHQQSAACSVVVSRSDGCVSLATERESTWHTEEWFAHKYKGTETPAEVWIACFDCFEPNVIATGADEGLLKLWDTRTGLAQPISCIRNHEAGVCSLQFNKRREHIFASGSYDSKFRVWDRRQLKSPIHPPVDVEGGVWRVKWHPKNDNQVLLACMRSGFIVYDCEAGRELSVFNNGFERGEWQDLAYGVDWVPFEGNRTLLGTASFYDKTFRILDTKLPWSC